MPPQDKRVGRAPPDERAEAEEEGTDIQEEDGVHEAEGEAVKPPDVAVVSQREGVHGDVHGHFHVVQEAALALPLVLFLAALSQMHTYKAHAAQPTDDRDLVGFTAGYPVVLALSIAVPIPACDQPDGHIHSLCC